MTMGWEVSVKGAEPAKEGLLWGKGAAGARLGKGGGTWAGNKRCLGLSCWGHNKAIKQYKAQHVLSKGKKGGKAHWALWESAWGKN